jgi:hypothetical protein
MTYKSLRLRACNFQESYYYFAIVAVTFTRTGLPSTSTVVAVNPPVVATTLVLPLADGLAGDKGILIISLPFSIFVSILIILS